ncbi:MAG: NRDE family protein [Ignavibacteriaceae bacterium]|nr:NRDE family protein [Ignavibacteriaceae bacterium]
MCLLLIAYNNHPLYKVIIAANRDEFYNRPAEPAKFWDDKPFLLGGKDLQAGGTWLGITKQGRFAAITNYRSQKDTITVRPTRGKIVTDFLVSKETPVNFANRLILSSEKYNGYNLIFMDYETAYYFSNKTKSALNLQPGTYALSNHLLDTPWPKVEKSKKSFSNIIKNENILAEDLFGILSDTSTPPDELLPDTGIGLEIERAVSPIFVSTPFYGTRSSTVILIDKQNNVTFVEKSLKDNNEGWNNSEFHFVIESH